MSAIFPLPHIIFFLATLFLPPGTKSFTTTLDVGRPIKATFTREADGWRATSEDGRDGGLWSMENLTVLETQENNTRKTELAEFVKIKKTGDGEKEVQVKGRPVSVVMTHSTLTFSQSEGGPLSQPVVLAYATGNQTSASKEESDEQAPKKKTSAEDGSTSAKPKGKDFHDQDLKGKDFSGASLDGADFSEATFDHTNLTNASARKADFKGANFVWLTAPNANFSGADFRETTFVGYFEGADFSDANFEGVVMKNAGLFGAKFRGANLQRTKGWSVSREADFSRADVRGANFRGVAASAMPRFRGAIYDEETAWPEGFDPKAAGAILKAAKAEGDASSSEAPRKKKKSADDDDAPKSNDN